MEIFGFRILAPNQVDPFTVEWAAVRAGAYAKIAQDAGRRCDNIANAIRELARQKEGGEDG